MISYLKSCKNPEMVLSLVALRACFSYPEMMGVESNEGLSIVLDVSDTDTFLPIFEQEDLFRVVLERCVGLDQSIKDQLHVFLADKQLVALLHNRTIEDGVRIVERLLAG